MCRYGLLHHLWHVRDICSIVSGADHMCIEILALGEVKISTWDAYATAQVLPDTACCIHVRNLLLFFSSRIADISWHHDIIFWCYRGYHWKKSKRVTWLYPANTKIRKNDTASWYITTKPSLPSGLDEIKDSKVVAINRCAKEETRKAFIVTCY